MIRNSDINDPYNTEMHRDVCISVDIYDLKPVTVYSCQFRNVSPNTECRLPALAANPQTPVDKTLLISVPMTDLAAERANISFSCEILFSHNGGVVYVWH
jgi:hypothetical protein